MKETKWDHFIEYVISRNLIPNDLLSEEKFIEIQTYLTTLEMLKKLEESLYSINWSKHE